MLLFELDYRQVDQQEHRREEHAKLPSARRDHESCRDRQRPDVQRIAHVSIRTALRQRAILLQMSGGPGAQRQAEDATPEARMPAMSTSAKTATGTRPPSGIRRVRAVSRRRRRRVWGNSRGAHFQGFQNFRDAHRAHAAGVGRAALVAGDRSWNSAKREESRRRVRAMPDRWVRRSRRRAYRAQPRDALARYPRRRSPARAGSHRSILRDRTGERERLRFV